MTRSRLGDDSRGYDDCRLGFLASAQRLEYRLIGPRPDDAPTLVLLHEGLGCVGLWGDFPDKLAAGDRLRRLRLFARRLRPVVARSTLPRPLDLHARRGARRAAGVARRHRLPARPADRPQRRRVDCGDLCRHASGSSPRRAGADRAAFLHRGDRASPRSPRRKTAYETTDLRAKLARWHKDPDNAFRGWNGAWLDPGFRAMGHHRASSPTSACRS